jgi:predicted RNA-binding Zn ribbon-like protein
MGKTGRVTENAIILSVREGLCLDYANTRSWRGSTAPSESLGDFSDLLGWLERGAKFPVAAVTGLRAWGRDHEGRAAAVFAEALALRETLFRIFRAVAEARPVAKRDFEALSHAIAAAPARGALMRAHARDRFGWCIDMGPAAPTFLAPVLWSAGDLLLAADAQRVRRCANDECLWLFRDASRTGTRRWCDMAACGNRAKAERHYARIKAQES